MKITLDLSKLLEEGAITHAEFDKFSTLAARGTGSLAFNMLVAFGVVAVSAAALALAPNAFTAIAIGLAIGAAGIALLHAGQAQWNLLANICTVVGALSFGGGVIWAGQGATGTYLLVAAVFAAAGILARSALLIVLAVIALSATLGTGTAYSHAAYFVWAEAPALTVLVFTIFSLGVYQLSKRLSAVYERLALAAARTGVFLVNLGFWIGSLWGDRINPELAIPDWVFAVAWAVALVATGAWAWLRGRRWVVNVVAVFAAIHFYTQWFERLGASPGTVLAAGLLAIGFALGVRMLNSRLVADTSAPSV